LLLVAAEDGWDVKKVLTDAIEFFNERNRG
jgi:hypothetical protein